MNEEDRGSPRDQAQNGLPASGRQAAGGPGPEDQSAPGGSSGSGGYGEAQNQALHQGMDPDGETRPAIPLSRGERFDEAQGGGRGADQVSELEADQRAHQDRGQSEAEEGSD